MPTSKQISVFLENKPGRMANVLSALAEAKVNISAMSVMDSHEHSTLRMVADDSGGARQILKQLNIPFAETDVLLVELRNQVGALAHVCEQLAAEHVNIDYAYCSSGGRNGKTLGIFRVSNLEKGLRVLNGSAGGARRKPERRPPRDRRAFTAANGSVR